MPSHIDSGLWGGRELGQSAPPTSEHQSGGLSETTPPLSLSPPPTHSLFEDYPVEHSGQDEAEHDATAGADQGHQSGEVGNADHDEARDEDQRHPQHPLQGDQSHDMTSGHTASQCYATDPLPKSVLLECRVEYIYPVSYPKEVASA